MRVHGRFLWSFLAVAFLLAVVFLVVVASSGVGVQTKSQTRNYFIAADEVAWNYAPAGTNVFSGAPFDEEANKFVQAGPDRIGSTYTKCLYRAYTDATFTQRIPRRDDEQYLGMLGPVIRAQVGDTIKVTFRNNCSFPASIHPHGVFYDKKYEGAAYNDGRSAADKAGDAVAPHQQYVYTWEVPDRAGPGPMDGSSVMWMYHSHTDEVPDVFSGLMGPMEITAHGRARPDGSPDDVDREIFAVFTVEDENQSHYLEAERTRLAKPPAADDAGFQESNKMHSISGYVYGNGPVMTMRQGQRVRWYVMSMGNEVDLHTPHWHGNTVTVNGMRTDTVSLLPATMVTADMVPDSPGMWGFHCHVSDHIIAGMLARYEVLPAKSP
ncbi:MAG TPA: multicopper oxidase domain-containing protein [Pseudonocardiaceae bacterium]|jgi:FtsP/CotA-like multicopper oxidase with cupredoxin domain|nr:multicopper oxidase domain-containing protein [Pseudonocardiaceae bacterium]